MVKKVLTQQEIEELQRKLEEAQQTLEAIRGGTVDALVDGEGRIFSLEGTETAYRKMVEAMNEGAMVTDAKGMVLYANHYLCTMLDIPAVSCIGKLIQDAIAPQCREDFDLFMRQSVSGRSVHGDFNFTRNDGTLIAVYLSSTPVSFSGKDAICIVAYDLTERKKAEEKLTKLNNELEKMVRERTMELKLLNENLEMMVVQRTKQVHDLSKALTIAEQKERKRFSQILHDDLLQTLFGAKMQIDVLKEEPPYSAGETKQDMDRLSVMIEKGIRTSRSLSLQLSPPILKNEGLDAALLWLSRHMEERYGLRVSIDVSRELSEVKNTDSTLIVQIARELLFNVARHAQTKEIAVSGIKSGASLEISFEDRGIGFDLEEVRKRGNQKTGLGLFNIEERLRLFGGILQINTAPGRGTAIKVIMPFSKEQ